VHGVLVAETTVLLVAHPIRMCSLVFVRSVVPAFALTACKYY
jgi:hypothetical protein